MIGQTMNNTGSRDVTTTEDRTAVAAIVMAGGRGQRLGPLTDDCAKPAIPFGSTYRVIDFSLSNCLNSGIHRIGVATQYQARSIASHVGQAWNQPRRTRRCIELWDAVRHAPEGRYTGTADAVFRNLDNLRSLLADGSRAARPARRLVLILAGDHIYQMDYRTMIASHLAAGADATVACIEAPLAEAARYGVLGTDRSLRIRSFAEKPTDPVPMPDSPDRALVSMGIYLFDFDVLARELMVDALTERSSHDFGNDVIPRLIHSHHLHAHRFHNRAGEPCFWRDVGTPDAYHETSLALLDPTTGFDPADPAWPIHSAGSNPHPVRFRNYVPGQPAGDDSSRPLQFERAAIRSSIGPGCIIAGGIVNHSVLAEGVTVAGGALVQDSVILADAQIGERSSIRRAIIMAGCRIPPGTRIGIDGVPDSLSCEITPAGVRIITPAAIERSQQDDAADTTGRRRSQPMLSAVR
jgi:glucose-1-phosphate adenylyltransferase